MNEDSKIYTVSEFIGFLNEGLKTAKVRVSGEVFDVKPWPSGYVYFKLKDDKIEATLNCKVWGEKLRIFGINLEYCELRNATLAIKFRQSKHALD